MESVHVLFHTLSRPFKFFLESGIPVFACLNTNAGSLIYAQLSVTIHFDYCGHSCPQFYLHWVLLLLVGSRKAAGDHLRMAVKSLHVELHGFLLSFLLL